MIIIDYYPFIESHAVLYVHLLTSPEIPANRNTREGWNRQLHIGLQTLKTDIDVNMQYLH